MERDPRRVPGALVTFDGSLYEVESYKLSPTFGDSMVLVNQRSGEPRDVPLRQYLESAKLELPVTVDDPDATPLSTEVMIEQARAQRTAA